MNAAQAVATSQNYHFFILVMFVVGYLIHMLLQADSIARAANNPLNTKFAVIKQNWPRMLARLFVSFLLFAWAWKNPSAVPSVLGFFGVTISANATAILTIPISPPVAGIFGFAVDSLLAYVPLLKNALPPVEMKQSETKTTDTPQSKTVETDTVEVTPKEGNAS